MTDRKRINLPWIAAAILGAVLIGGGAYFLQGQYRCSGLEEDYLNSISSLRGNAILRAANPGSSEFQSNVDKLDEIGLRSVEVNLQAVYDQCGERAGATAARKGTELMLDTI